MGNKVYSIMCSTAIPFSNRIVIVQQRRERGTSFTAYDYWPKSRKFDPPLETTLITLDKFLSVIIITKTLQEYSGGVIIATRRCYVRTCWRQ